MKATLEIRELIEASMRAQGINNSCDLARASGIHSSTVRRILNGQVKTISDETAEALCATLGVSFKEMSLLSTGRLQGETTPEEVSNLVREAQSKYIARNVPFDMPEELANTMLTTCAKEGITFQEYFEQLIKADQIRRGEA